MPRYTLSELAQKGVAQPAKLGRPRLYATDEERLAVKKAQQRACVLRHAARVKEAMALLRQQELLQLTDQALNAQ